MLSTLPQQAIVDPNCVVDAWIEDMLIAHDLPVNDRDFYIHGPQLPKPNPSPSPSPATHSNLSSSRPYATHLPNRRGKRKRHPSPLQSTDPNMDLTSSQPPTPPPSKGTATKKPTAKGYRKEKSDKTEVNVQAQGNEVRKSERTRNTPAASAASSQARPSRGPVTKQHKSASSPLNQVHLPPPVSPTVASAFGANAALVLRPTTQPESTTGQQRSPTRK